MESVALWGRALSYGPMPALTRRFAALSPTARGAFWMLYAAFGFSASAGLIRPPALTVSAIRSIVIVRRTPACAAWALVLLLG